MDMKPEYILLARLENIVAEIKCLDPDGDLTPEQIAAIHVMKHEMMSAIHRAYMHVPAARMNEFLKSFITALAPLATNKKGASKAGLDSE